MLIKHVGVTQNCMYVWINKTKHGHNGWKLKQHRQEWLQMGAGQFRNSRVAESLWELLLLHKVLRVQQASQDT